MTHEESGLGLCGSWEAQVEIKKASAQATPLSHLVAVLVQSGEQVTVFEK